MSYACHSYHAMASMPIEKLAMLPSLRRQNLLAELCAKILRPVSICALKANIFPVHSAGLKQSCPPGVFVSLTPGDPTLWSGVIFVRKGTCCDSSLGYWQSELTIFNIQGHMPPPFSDSTFRLQTPTLHFRLWSHFPPTFSILL